MNGVARHRINTKLIEEHWDDMLRLAGSLKLGTVQAAAVMKTLRIDDRPTKLAQAVAELGRIDKRYGNDSPESGPFLSRRL